METASLRAGGAGTCSGEERVGSVAEEERLETAFFLPLKTDYKREQVERRCRGVGQRQSRGDTKEGAPSACEGHDPREVIIGTGLQDYTKMIGRSQNEKRKDFRLLARRKGGRSRNAEWVWFHSLGDGGSSALGVMYHVLPCDVVGGLVLTKSNIRLIYIWSWG